MPPPTAADHPCRRCPGQAPARHRLPGAHLHAAVSNQGATAQHSSTRQGADPWHGRQAAPSSQSCGTGGTGMPWEGRQLHLRAVEGRSQKHSCACFKLPCPSHPPSLPPQQRGHPPGWLWLPVLDLPGGCGGEGPTAGDAGQCCCKLWARAHCRPAFCTAPNRYQSVPCPWPSCCCVQEDPYFEYELFYKRVGIDGAFTDQAHTLARYLKENFPSKA